MIQYFMILQLKHTSLITQSLKEIRRGFIDTGAFIWRLLWVGNESFVSKGHDFMTPKPI